MDSILFDQEWQRVVDGARYGLSIAPMPSDQVADLMLTIEAGNAFMAASDALLANPDAEGVVVRAPSGSHYTFVR